MIKEMILLIMLTPLNPEIEPEILQDYTDRGGIVECEKAAETLNLAEADVDRYVTNKVFYQCERGYISSTVEWEFSVG